MLKKIYLAGGCFWGLQKYLSLINGVIATQVGYANGASDTPSPTYEQVCNGSGHAETVLVEYDDSILPLTRLLDLYLDVIDPTSINKQGGDIGEQYRTGVYYTLEQDLRVISGWLTLIGEGYDKPIAIELKPLENYYPAEEYHQNYLDKNPGGYCHISPGKFECAANAVHKASDPSLKSQLTAMQYEVAVCGATEPPFDNEYFNNFESGVYVDVISGKPLFISTDKFESGCGWPAFSKPIDEALIEELEDNSYGRRRTEVRAMGTGSHLGHVFDDGPEELGGLRYCINSASLRFVPKEAMEESGYGMYLNLLK